MCGIESSISFPLDYQTPLKMIINFTVFFQSFLFLRRIHEIGIDEYEVFIDEQT